MVWVRILQLVRIAGGVSTRISGRRCPQVQYTGYRSAPCSRTPDSYTQDHRPIMCYQINQSLISHPSSLTPPTPHLISASSPFHSHPTTYTAHPSTLITHPSSLTHFPHPSPLLPHCYTEKITHDKFCKILEQIVNPLTTMD